MTLKCDIISIPSKVQGIKLSEMLGEKWTCGFVLVNTYKHTILIRSQ